VSDVPENVVLAVLDAMPRAPMDALVGALTTGAVRT